MDTSPEHIDLAENYWHASPLPSPSSTFSSSSTETAIAIPSPAAPHFSPVVSLSSQLSSTSSSEGEGDKSQGLFPKTTTYKLVGDNIDKTVKPRHMRMDNQARSLHYFHTYGVRDRIDISHLEDQPSLPSLDDVDVATLLPTRRDEQTLKGLFSIHISRVLKKHMQFFTKFGEGLGRHIQHEYSAEMSKKSEVVSATVGIDSS